MGVFEMSFGGNNGGFDDDSRRGSQPTGQRTYPQSYNDPGFGQPVKQSGNKALYWILGIVSAVTIGGALVCCGGGYFLVRFTTNELAKQFRGPVQNSPEVAEHIGDIEDMTLSFQAMQAAGDQGKLVFEVKGSKGSGKVVVDMSKAERDPDKAFELVLSDGTRLPMTEVDMRQLGGDDIDTEFAPANDASEMDDSDQPSDADIDDASPTAIDELEPAT
jgi:hypothetical protein